VVLGMVVPRQPLRHRAAAGVTGADEQDTGHVYLHSNAVRGV
jgi:hypothetical protein